MAKLADSACRLTGSTARDLEYAHGIGYCNITKCWTKVCAEGITITDNAIIPLKERVIDQLYDPTPLLALTDQFVADPRRVSDAWNLVEKNPVRYRHDQRILRGTGRRPPRDAVLLDSSLKEARNSGGTSYLRTTGLAPFIR